MSQLGLDLGDQLPSIPSRPKARERIDPRTLARRENPETSKEAAAATVQFGGSHRERILAALELGAATYHELGERTGIVAHAVSRRMHELEKLGLAERTNETRPSPTGQRCAVWRKK